MASPIDSSKKVKGTQLRETFLSDDGLIAHFVCPHNYEKTNILYDMIKVKKQKEYRNLLAAKVVFPRFQSKSPTVVELLRKDQNNIKLAVTTEITYDLKSKEHLPRREAQILEDSWTLGEIWSQEPEVFKSSEYDSKFAFSAEGLVQLSVTKLRYGDNAEDAQIIRIPTEDEEHRNRKPRKKEGTFQGWRSLQRETEWFVKMKSPLDDVEGWEKIPGVTHSMYYIGVRGTTSPTHSEDYHGPSAHYLATGSAQKDWLLFHCEHLAKLNLLVKSGPDCPMEILHKHHVSDTETLDDLKIPHHILSQYGGELVVTFSEGSHMVQNGGVNIGIAKNWWYPEAAITARSIQRCLCPDAEGWKWLHNLVYGGERNVQMKKDFARRISKNEIEEIKRVFQKSLKRIEDLQKSGEYFEPQDLQEYDASGEDDAEVQQNTDEREQDRGEEGGAGGGGEESDQSDDEQDRGEEGGAGGGGEESDQNDSESSHADEVSETEEEDEQEDPPLVESESSDPTENDVPSQEDENPSHVSPTEEVERTEDSLTLYSDTNDSMEKDVQVRKAKNRARESSPEQENEEQISINLKATESSEQFVEPSVSEEEENDENLPPPETPKKKATKKSKAKVSSKNAPKLKLPAIDRSESDDVLPRIAQPRLKLPQPPSPKTDSCQPTTSLSRGINRRKAKRIGSSKKKSDRSKNIPLIEEELLDMFARYEKRSKRRNALRKKVAERTPEEKKLEAEKRKKMDEKKKERERKEISKKLEQNRNNRSKNRKSLLKRIAKMEREKAEDDPYYLRDIQSMKETFKRLNEEHIFLKVISALFNADAVDQQLNEIGYTPLNFIRNYVSSQNKAQQLLFWKAVQNEVIKIKEKEKDQELLRIIDDDICSSWAGMFNIKPGMRVSCDDPAEFLQIEDDPGEPSTKSLKRKKSKKAKTPSKKLKKN